MPLYLLLSPPDSRLWLLWAALAACVLGETGRRQRGAVGTAVRRLFGAIMRPQEHGIWQLTGASWFVVGSLLAVGLSGGERVLVATAVSVLIVSDTLASLVGGNWGRHPLAFGKSWEGTASFLLSAWAVTLALLWGDDKAVLLAGGVACMVATGLELGAGRLRVDDNLLIPVGYVLSAQGVLWLAG